MNKNKYKISVSLKVEGHTLKETWTFEQKAIATDCMNLIYTSKKSLIYGRAKGEIITSINDNEMSCYDSKRPKSCFCKIIITEL